MRIGLNLLYLIPSVVGGTETYASGLLRGLIETESVEQIIVFVNQEAANWPLPSAPNLERVVCMISAKNRMKRYIFEQSIFPLLLRQHRIDLVHSLGYVGPILTPYPAVITIPDPNFVDLAHTIPTHQRLALRFFSTQAARTAQQVITISEFSKVRLCQALRLPVEKITVTHLAQGIETNAVTKEDWSDIASQYNIQKPYIIAFGGKALHKNIATLIQAFSKLSDQLPHSLVLMGHIPSNVDIDKISQKPGLRERIITTGYVPGPRIAPLLGGADIFVLPSLYEGFGLPVLEAQQAGVAVICSTAGSLPEIAGHGAAFFDPRSVDELAQTIQMVLMNNKMKCNLIENGYENLRRFS
jgi:glycosyltransferase involved in cell wall biosynthesis